MSAPDPLPAGAEESRARGSRWSRWSRWSKWLARAALLLGAGAAVSAPRAPSIAAIVLSAGQLRRNVTSPGGTTEAALGVLMADDGMSPLMRRAVDAATQRSRELAG